jgi:hypothetical protein
MYLALFENDVSLSDMAMLLSQQVAACQIFRLEKLLGH